MKGFPFSGRCGGLLAPVFALRRADDLGIGDTRAVCEAIDFCAAHGFAVLQLLPIGETIGDHSPYSPISSRALSPALLTFAPEVMPGLTPAMLRENAPSPPVLAALRAGPVQHEAVGAFKWQLLRAAHEAFSRQAEPALRREFRAYQVAQSDWLPAYTLYRLLVEEYGGRTDRAGWRAEHQTPAAAEHWLAHEPGGGRVPRELYAFAQWVAWRQLQAVRAHAEARGVRLMGEMPFGVSRQSADVWARPDLFQLENNMGTPPLAYFDTSPEAERWGQNWGFPPFRWAQHRAESFAWLRGRAGYARSFFHLLRIDHLRGLFRAYVFPWAGGAEHAEFSRLGEDEIRARTGGRWPHFEPGPDDHPASAAQNDRQGRELLGVWREAAGEMALVGEIMGALPGYLARALDDLQMPSLTFPQLERQPDRSLRPLESFRPLSLVSYANHDHAPLAALYRRWQAEAAAAPGGLAARDRQALLALIGWRDEPPAQMTPALLAALQRALFSTPCALAVLLTSDLLGTEQRFNLPGSYGENTWNERLPQPLPELARDPCYGPRIATAARLLRESGRAAQFSG